MTAGNSSAIGIRLLMTGRAIQAGDACAFRTAHDVGNVTAPIVVEVIPDAGLLRGTFQVFPRRKRIKELEGLVLDNPSVGNWEELGDLYLAVGLVLCGIGLWRAYRHIGHEPAAPG